MKEAGISVITGILEDKTRVLNEVFIKNITQKSPYIHLKIAQTADGRIAAQDGSSKWITDDDARNEVHTLRSKYDAVLIGSKTAIIDNPLLTVRNGMTFSPLRIVLDSKLQIDSKSNLLSDKDSNNTLIVTGNSISEKEIKRVKNDNSLVIKIPLDKNGYINLNKLLNNLWLMNIRSILVEGGSEIFTSFIREKLFDKISIFIAPQICGNGINAINDIGTNKMSESMKLQNVSYQLINDQIVLTGYRN